MGKFNQSKFLILTAIVPLFAIAVNATPVDLDIYSNRTITDGEVYGAVNVYNSAVLNYLDGEIVWLVAHDHSIVNVHSAYGTDFQLEDNSKINLHSGGLDFQVSFTSGSDNSELHIYGYDLTYVPDVIGILEGSWDGIEMFRVLVRHSANVEPNVILHEIPEPTSGLIFISLVLMARLKNKTT